MKSALLLSELFFVLAFACEQILPYPDPDFPSLSLGASLRRATCFNVTLDLTATEAPAVLEVLYDVSLLRLNCSQAAILLETDILSAVDIVLEKCDVHVTRGGLGVYGKVYLRDCTVHESSFLVWGSIYAEGSLFRNNSESVFVVTGLGMCVFIRHSVFEENTGPVGAILRFIPTVSPVLLDTNITFDTCVFRNNSATQVGSFLYVDVSKGLSTVRIEVRNCAFRGNTGILSYLSLASTHAFFDSNEMSDSSIPFFLKLYSGSVSLKNTTMSNVAKAVLCLYVNASISLLDTDIENASDGPAVLFANTAPASAALVSIQGLHMRNVSQTDSSLFVSTIYILAVPVTLQDVVIEESYTFGAGCGAFFFTESVVRNCSIRDSACNQGGLIGYMGGHGIASHLLARDVYTRSKSMLLTMQARVQITNLTVLYSPSRELPNYDDLFTFLNSQIVFSDTHVDIPSGSSALCFKVLETFISLSHLHFRQMHGSTFFQAIKSNVTLSEVTSEAVSVVHFANIGIDSTLQLSRLSFRSAHISGALLSVKTLCTASVSHVSLSAGDCHSLVTSFSSEVRLFNVSLAETSGDTLFVSWIGSVITAAEVTGSDGVFNLATCESGSVFLESAHFTNITIPYAFVQLRNGEAILTNVAAVALHVLPLAFFVTATQHSLLAMESCVLQHIWASEPSLTQFTNSAFELRSVRISRFNVTFATLSKSTFLIHRSEVTYGSQAAFALAGLVDAADSSGVVNMSRFYNVSAVTAGVFSLLSAQVQIVDSYFENCSAAQTGGVVSLFSASLDLSRSTFIRNSAQIGGVVFFDCASVDCTATLTSCEFANNSAVEGGVFKWTRVRPILRSLQLSNNSAVYGDEEASLPTHIALVDATHAVMTGVAGVRIVAPILIESLDWLNQRVRTDNSTTVQLRSNDIVGTSSMTVQCGLANFSGIIVQTHPGTSVQIQALGIGSSTFNITYFTRTCVPGEVVLPSTCFLCPNGTYSLNPADTYCRNCPAYASCPGGSSILLDEGYWRESNLTDEVFVCPNKAACGGGENATCSSGYAGEMCGSCADGYYSIGSTVCAECESTAAIVIRAFGVCIIAMSVFVTIYDRPSLDMEKVATIRILRGYAQFLLLLLLIPVNWQGVTMDFLAFNEMLMSFGLSSLSLDCWADSHPAVYWKAVVATAFPIVFFLAALLLYACIKRKCARRAFSKASNIAIFLLSWIHPYVIKCLMAIVACKKPVREWVLGCDSAVGCWGLAHWKFVLGLFVPGFVLFGLAFPILFTLYLKGKLHREPTQRTHFYTAGLKAEYSAFAAVKATKLEVLLIGAALLQVREPIFLVLLLTGVLYLELTWFATREVYELPVHCKLGNISRALQVLFTALSFFFVPTLHVKDYLLISGSSLIIATFLGFALLCVWLIRNLRVSPTVSEAVPQLVDIEQLVSGGLIVPAPSLESHSVLSADSVSLNIS